MAKHRPIWNDNGEEGERSSASQRLVEAALRGDSDAVEELIEMVGSLVDMEYVGTVTLRVRISETIIGEERPDEVRMEREEFRTEVTALFAAAHSGHTEIVKMLLSAGADINHKLFRGYTTSAAAREGHYTTLDLLLKGEASSDAREEALFEASICNEADSVRLLMSSSIESNPLNSASRALITASSRGFINVVVALVENGVDIDCVDRFLLRSMKPSLHANVDCTPLVAAIISRQISVVKFLLEAGAKTDYLVRVGAWSWDAMSAEEMRVGACLGNPYNAAWCAVEYYESTGEILRLLITHKPSLLETSHIGRTLLCHAILCQNCAAVRLLLDAGASPRFRIRTRNGHESHLIHFAAQIGSVDAMKELILHGCDINSRNSDGETALMVSANSNNPKVFLELLMSGADLGVLNSSGENAVQLANRSTFGGHSVTSIFSQVLKSGRRVCSTNIEVFSPLHYVTGIYDSELLQVVLRSSIDVLNKFDSSGYTPVMVAAKSSNTEAFRHLVMAGADISIRSKDGKSLMSVIQSTSDTLVRESFDDILLSAALANVLTDRVSFGALHYAARKGDLSSLIQLLKMGFPVDALDEGGNSSLMIASFEGHAESCKLLLMNGANCRLTNRDLETPLSLCRRSSRSNKGTECTLLDHLARLHVLNGEELMKHTRGGRGSPHRKAVKMLETGMISWGRTSRRNVAIKQALLGPSSSFAKNRGGRGGSEEEDRRRLIFHVVGENGREIHFEVELDSSLELWVRGVNLVVKEKLSVSCKPTK